MTDWLARAQLVAAELCQRYRQIDSVLADNEAQEAAMLYELCPKLRKWKFDGWVCHRVWVAHLLHKQRKAPGDISGADNTEGNMPKGTHLTEEQKQRIISDVRGGMKQKDAAEKYGVGYSTVAKLTQGLKKYGAVTNEVRPDGRDVKPRRSEGAAATNEVRKDEHPESGADGFVFAEGMTKEQREKYTADVIAEVEGAAGISTSHDVERCENAAEPAETLPESSETEDGVPGPDRLTVKQLIKLHWTDDILYFYEYSDEYEPDVVDGKWDFSRTELFLAYHSSVVVEHMLTQQVLERTVRRIYNDDGIIRIFVDKQEDNEP